MMALLQPALWPSMQACVLNHDLLPPSASMKQSFLPTSCWLAHANAQILLSHLQGSCPCARRAAATKKVSTADQAALGSTSPMSLVLSSSASASALMPYATLAGTCLMDTATFVGTCTAKTSKIASAPVSACAQPPADATEPHEFAASSGVARAVLLAQAGACHTPKQVNTSDWPACGTHSRPACGYRAAKCYQHVAQEPGNVKDTWGHTETSAAPS